MTDRQIVERSAGSLLIERLERWIASYMYLPDPTIALVVALYCVGTWVFDRFYSWPYLAVTGAVKGCGKTQLLEIMQLVCRGGKLVTSVRPFSMLRLIQEMANHITILWDESESSSSEAKSFMSELLNAGYRSGHTIDRAFGKILYSFTVYCPKVFAMIGDPAGTVRDRSIVLTLERGKSERDFIPETAAPEGEILSAEIKAVLSQGAMSVEAARPDWLQTRNREIWGSMLGLANWLKLDATQLARLRSFAEEQEGTKTASKRKSVSSESEEDAVNAQFSELAVHDLRACFKEGEPNLFSALAVQRMQALHGRWRTFKGSGLDQIQLAALLSVHAVGSKTVWMGKGRLHRKQGKGYALADIRKATKGV